MRPAILKPKSEQVLQLLRMVRLRMVYVLSPNPKKTMACSTVLFSMQTFSIRESNTSQEKMALELTVVMERSLRVMPYLPMPMVTAPVL